jgi:hypothetical protein
MTKQCLGLLVCLSFGHAEMVDRISIIVDGHLIKHSAIIRDIRLTDFLNHDTPAFDAGEQKKAAGRLIDQALIRKELLAGSYTGADATDVDALLQQIKQGLGSDAAYQRALAAYGISDDELRRHLNWQLSVLRFINVRFATGAQIPDAEVRAYYQQHLAEFRRAGKPKLDLESLRPDIEQAIAGERVNQQFFTWLNESEKNTPVVYNEEALK